jgi:predicted Zn-dependent peptidase
LARIAQHRWQATTPELEKQPVFVRSDAFVLPGAIVMGATVNSSHVSDSLTSARKVFESFANTPVTVAELDRAKTEVVNEVSNMMAKPDSLPDPWLDAETYRLRGIQNQVSLLRNVTASDIQRVASRLFKTTAIASVLAGDAMQLKAALEGRVTFEVLGEIANPTPSPSPKPAIKPTGNDNPE